MAGLTNEVKRFIVMHLAMYDTPMEVVRQVKEEFEIDVTRQAVHYYDPTIGERTEKRPKHLVELFHKTRADFREEALEIPIAIRAVRLRRLDRLFQNAGKNAPLAAALMEQAAKDIGGMFTNRRELTGADGSPLMPMTDDERRERAVEIMREAAKRRSAAEKDHGQPAPAKRAVKKTAAKTAAKKAAST